MEDELTRLSAARFIDRDRLARVEEMARGFEEQADALAEASASRGAAQTLVDEASDLFDYFRRIEERVESIIEASLE